MNNKKFKLTDEEILTSTNYNQKNIDCVREKNQKSKATNTSDIKQGSELKKEMD